MTLRSIVVPFVATALLAFVGCGGEQHGAAPPLQPLAESRALEIIAQAFQDTGVQFELHRQLQLPGNRHMEIDYSTAGHPHGVEFVTEQDRVDFGDVIPHRRSADALVTLVGAGPDANTDILVLDDREFMFQPDAAYQGAGQPTLFEVEDRLRRNVVDYLTYMRQHGQL